MAHHTARARLPQAGRGKAIYDVVAMPFHLEIWVVSLGGIDARTNGGTPRIVERPGLRRFKHHLTGLVLYSDRDGHDAADVAYVLVVVEA